MRIANLLLPMLVLALLGCGGGGGGDFVAPGTLSLRLGADSLPGYTQAVVSVEKVEASQDGSSWTTLGTVRATYDLRQLQGGNSAALVTGAGVRSGAFQAFRITWALVNYADPTSIPAYVVTPGTKGAALAMPVTTPVSGRVEVPANGSGSGLLMLDGGQMVQARTAAATPYAFQATGRAFDLATAPTIRGHLADGATALAGAEVYAETVDGAGLATLQRRAFTDAAGGYVLEGLLPATLYFVVAQPAGYGAAAGSPVQAAAGVVYIQDLAFSAPKVPGTLTLAVTPASPANTGTWGELRQSLSTGNLGSQMLIVRSGTVATGPGQDLATFAGLAPAVYGVAAQRSVNGAAPVLKVTASQQLVTAGAVTAAAVTYP